MKKKYILFFIVAFVATMVWNHITDSTYKPTAAAANETEDGHSVSPYIHFRESMQRKINSIHGYVHPDRIPKSLKQAIVAVEDKRFYEHGAVDPFGIIRAAAVNVYSGETVEGGSTLSQQVIKNSFLSQERTLSRKGRELFLSILLERNYTKDEILAIYLNTAYFGANATGINQASRIYFGIDTESLTLAQSAMLAGLVQAPTYYNPFENYSGAKARQKTVLEQMVSQDMITRSQAETAYRENIHLQKQGE